jgi:hypothetical protein
MLCLSAILLNESSYFLFNFELVGLQNILSMIIVKIYTFLELSYIIL